MKRTVFDLLYYLCSYIYQRSVYYSYVSFHSVQLDQCLYSFTKMALSSLSELYSKFWKSGGASPPTLLFFFHIVLAILGLLLPLINFRSVCFATEIENKSGHVFLHQNNKMNCKLYKKSHQFYLSVEEGQERKIKDELYKVYP